MKITNWGIVFIILISPFLLGIYLKDQTIKMNQHLTNQYDTAITAAVKDAGKILLENLEQEYESSYESSKFARANKEEAVKTFFKTLAVNFGVENNDLGQGVLSAYVPVVAVIDYDGFYLYVLNEYKNSSGEIKLEHVWLPKKTYSYTDSNGHMLAFTLDDYVVAYDAIKHEWDEGFRGEIEGELNIPLLKDADKFEQVRRITILNAIQDEIEYLINRHNTYAKHYGITYTFTLPLISQEDWNNTIDDIGIIAFVQGVPLGGGHERYNNYAFGGARIVKTIPYHGIERNGLLYYYREDEREQCQVTESIKEYFSNAKEAAENGYFPLEKCSGSKQQNNIKTIVLMSKELPTAEQIETFTIKGLKEIHNISSNTGSAEILAVDDDNVTVKMSGGQVSRTVQTEGKAIANDKKTVIDVLKSTSDSYIFPPVLNYSVDGYIGTLVKLGKVIKQQTGGTYEPVQSKFVTNHPNEHYFDVEGYSGKLERYVHSGSYIPEERKLERYVQSGEYIPRDEKRLNDYVPPVNPITCKVDQTFIISGNMNQKIRSWRTSSAGSTTNRSLRFYYDEDGYRGSLNPISPQIVPVSCFTFYMNFWGEVEKEFGAFLADLNLTGSELKDYIQQMQGNPVRHNSFKRIDALSLNPSRFIENGNQFEFTLSASYFYTFDEIPVKYEGTVVRAEKDTRVFGYRTIITRPAVDTRVFRYQGTVIRPSVDTRTYEYIQEYRGTVMKKGNDTRTYEHYYQYELTIEYE